MSGDLISRSAFIKEINEHMKNVYECDIKSVSDFQDGNNSEESYIVQGLFEAFELIGNLPTAYDVDKVVERLKQIKTDNSCKNCTYREKCDELQEYYNPNDEVDLCALVAKELSIEIIKSGGIINESR